MIQIKQSENINVRITPELKNAVEEVLNKQGLKLSEAIRMFLKEIKESKSIPLSLQSKTSSNISDLESSGVIQLLKDQLKSKDEQLEKKDKLLENMQVLLKNEQEKNKLLLVAGRDDENNSSETIKTYQGIVEVLKQELYSKEKAIIKNKDEENKILEKIEKYEEQIEILKQELQNKDIAINDLNNRPFLDRLFNKKN